MRAQLHPNGTLLFRRQTYRATFGKTGITTNKQEGDGATPAGILPLRRVLYRADRVPRPAACVPVEPLSPNDGWCDDPTHPDYNRMVTLPHPAGHEALWRADALYDIVGVLGWNDSPVQRGRGSAIFLHLARPDGGPTEGCIGISAADLAPILPALTEIDVLT
jgi:L,D-peptidoglycan transpeptidase YkuD (ErfK/YbiS/YcfS/YnhG family)